MLKFFGLKEIFYGVKRFAVVLIAFTVIFAALGFMMNSSNNISDSSTVFSSSKSYIINAKAENDLENQSVSDRACAETVAEMINSDFSRDYVLDKLLLAYTPEQIVSYTGGSYYGDEINNVVLQDCINVSILGNTAIVNFFTTVYNKDFSEDLISYFDDYFNQYIVNKVSNIENITYAGGTTSIVEGFGMDSSESASSFVSAIIFAIVGFILGVLLIMAYVLFNPSIASKQDFVNYGFEIIDDVKNHVGSGVDFASDAVVNAFNKSSCNEITLVSSLADKSIVSYVSSISGKISADVLSAFKITKDYDELKKIKGKDKVILVERKGRSSHQQFCNTVDILKQYDIEIIGVLLV